jgi:hypothetical protein
MHVILIFYCLHVLFCLTYAHVLDATRISLVTGHAATAM